MKEAIYLNNPMPSSTAQTSYIKENEDCASWFFLSRAILPSSRKAVKLTLAG